MHEYSLVQALLRHVERLAAQHCASRVDEVRVRLGPLSNVEPLLVESAFQTLAPATVAAESRLVMEEVPLTARCAVCDSKFEIIRFQFRCPACDSAEIAVTAGDGFVLESVTLRREEPALDRV